MNKHIRILSGRHRGASLQLAPGTWRIGCDDAEHGRYWRDNIFQTDDEMFEQIADGSYLWMKV